jgi:hypothetical protein
MKTINLIEQLILEANRKDILVNKLGLSQDNADQIEELGGPLSIILANKLIDVFAQQRLEHMMSAVPEDEEKQARETFRKDPEYRRKMGIDAINKSAGVRGMRSNIVSIMDWIRIGLNGNLGDNKNLNFGQLYNESRKWHQELTSGEGDINYVEKNDIVKDYRNKDGVGFYWVDLNTNDSREECNRMGHCGRTNSSNTIFSLRETKKLKDNYTVNKSHLTAAIGDEDGIVYQLKGPKNSKPKPEFYPYVVDLILNTDIVKGFGSEYNSGDDFSIADLSDEQITQIYQSKPEIFNTRKLKRKLQKMGITQDFQEPDTVFDWDIEPDSVPYYVEGDWTIRQSRDASGRTKKIGFIETLLSGDIWELTDGYYDDWKSALEYHADEDNKRTIIDYLRDRAGEEFEPNMSIDELIEEYDDNYEVRGALGSAFSDSANSSYYDYAMKQLRNALSDYGDVLSLNDRGATIRINLKNIIDNMGYGEDEMDEFFEKCDDDAQCVFHELLGEYYEKPRFYIDDRWSPDIDDNDFNSYLNDRLSEL